MSRVIVPGAARPVSVLSAALQPRGALVLIGALKPGVLPPGLPRELGAALERAWRVAERVERTRLLTALARLGLSSEPLDAVYRAFAEAVSALVRFDSIGVSLVDVERAEFTIVDLPARTLGLGARRDGRMALARTLLADVVERERSRYAWTTSPRRRCRRPAGRRTPRAGTARRCWCRSCLLAEWPAP